MKSPFLATLVAVLACLTSVAHAGADRIVINQSATSLSGAAIYVAREAGFFAHENLDVEFVVTGSGIKSIIPLVNGDTQFCACISSHPLDAMVAGAGDTKIIGTVLNGYNHKIVLSKVIAARLGVTEASPMRDRVLALKGLKIGITEPNASTDQMTRFVMRQFGLDGSRDATLIALGVPSLIPALHNQQIDAFDMSSPVPERAVSDGDAITLIDLTKDKFPILEQALYMTISVDPGYLKSHRDVAVRLMRAVAGAEAYIQDHQQDARKLLRAKVFPQMDEAAFDISFENNYPYYAKTPEVTRASFDAAVALESMFSKVPVHLSFDDIVDNSLLPPGQ
jgi:NitT/TauT family transport system substrate-binding protein